MYPLLHININRFDKCHKCRILLTTVASVTCCSQVLHVDSQVSQMSSKAYCHDNDTKETLTIPQTPNLEEKGWLNEVGYLLPPKRSFQAKVLRESGPLYHP
jgi:hypothetical protein